MEKKIKQKFTAHQWALIEAQKPYPGGNDALWAVNEIANADKHRKGLVEVLPQMDGGVGISGKGYSKSGSISTRPADCDFFLQDKEREKVIARIEGTIPNLKVNPLVTPSVVFGDLMPVQGKNVLVMLNQQIRLVEGIVQTLKRTFF